jgi:hypothetical protein
LLVDLLLMDLTSAGRPLRLRDRGQSKGLPPMGAAATAAGIGSMVDGRWWIGGGRGRAATPRYGSSSDNVVF